VKDKSATFYFAHRAASRPICTQSATDVDLSKMKGVLIKKAFRKPYKYLLKKIDAKTFNNSKKVDTVLIGSPRSGTTWFLDILSRYSGFCSLYEPLHYRWFPKAWRAGFKHRRRLHPKKKYDKEKVYIKSIINGNVYSQEPRIFLDQSFANISNEILKRKRANKIAVKFVRAGRMLGWMMNRFNELNYIHLIRHPCAVIKSQIENNISGHLKSINNPYEQLVVSGRISNVTLMREAYELEDKYKSRCREVLEGNNSLLAKLSVVWALDNAISFQDMSRSGEAASTVRYEDFLRKGYQDKLNVLEDMGFSRKMLGKKGMSQIKAMMKPNRLEGRLYSWKNYFADKDIRNIMEIVSYISKQMYEHWNYKSDLKNLQ